jgi:hypothetical protein
MKIYVRKKLLVRLTHISHAAKQQRRLLNYLKYSQVLFCIFNVPTKAKKNFYSAANGKIRKKVGELHIRKSHAWK